MSCIRSPSRAAFVANLWEIRGSPRVTLSSCRRRCRSNEESTMSRPESSRVPGTQDRTWLSRCQVVGVALFLTLFACLVVWTTVAMPGPIVDLNVDFLVPAASAGSANRGQSNMQEAP